MTATKPSYVELLLTPEIREEEEEPELEVKSVDHVRGAKKQSSKLQCIVVTAVLIAIVVIALAVGLGVGLPLGLRSSDGAPCRTAECSQLAAVVMSGIDASVDPCQDFYNFSCGNWMDTVPNITGM